MTGAEIADDSHALDAITGPTTALRARCTCGYSTPPVHDKRTAVQAHLQHQKENEKAMTKPVTPVPSEDEAKPDPTYGYLVWCERDMTEGKQGSMPRLDLGVFITEDSAWSWIGEGREGIFGRKPEGGDWRTSNMGDWDVQPVVINVGRSF